LLTGQIDVENPDKNYKFSNIESTVHVTCKSTLTTSKADTRVFSC